MRAGLCVNTVWQEQASSKASLGCSCPWAPRNAALAVRRYSRLHHNHAGVVSLSADGTEVAVTFDKALSLDKDYQVAPCQPSLKDHSLKLG